MADAPDLFTVKSNPDEQCTQCDNRGPEFGSWFFEAPFCSQACFEKMLNSLGNVPDKPKEKQMEPQTYEEYLQAVYAELQRATGKDWSKSQLDVTEEFTEGISPADVVAEQLSHTEPEGEDV